MPTSSNSKLPFNKKLTVPILSFHKIDSSFEWGVTRLPPKRFRKVIQYLKRSGYQTISLTQLIKPAKILPANPVVITFDDSYESVYTHALPIMQEFDYTGTIFVVTDYINQLNSWDVNLGWLRFKHLSWNQIRQLDEAGFEIGSHTKTHPDLTRIGQKRMLSEIKESKINLEDHLGRVVDFISFPFSRYDANVVDACQQVGYRKGCGFWLTADEKKKNDPFVLKTKAYYLFDTIWNLKSKIDKTFWSPIEDLKLRAVNFCSQGTALVKSY